MQETDFNKIEKELLAFTKSEVVKFLSQHPNKIFYGFAFDCNAEYGEVNLCFNTMDDFNETLLAYQRGRFGEFYLTTEQINNLKYSTGDWEYQCFSSMHVLTDEELEEIYDLSEDNDDLHDETNKTFLMHFSRILLEFCKTEEFKQIPKTKDFKVICIDHEEDLEEAELRMEILLSA